MKPTKDQIEKWLPYPYKVKETKKHFVVYCEPIKLHKNRKDIFSSLWMYFSNRGMIKSKKL